MLYFIKCRASTNLKNYNMIAVHLNKIYIISMFKVMDKKINRN